MTRPFQLILPLADLDSSSFKSPPPFAALAAECSEEKILSVHYLLADGLEKAMAVYRKTPLTDGQKQLAAKLKTRLCDYFSQGREFGGFGDLSLSYSMLAERVQECRVNLPPNECEQALKKIRDIVHYGQVAFYGDIGEQVDWDDRQAVRDACRYDARGRPAKNPLAVAVGAACPVNPFSLIVPCFRIVSANGRLAGFAGNEGVEDEEAARIKAWLLEQEGHTIHEEGEDARKWKVEF